MTTTRMRSASTGLLLAIALVGGSGSAEPPRADEFSVRDVLAQLPADALGEGWVISTGDLDAAGEANGLPERPAEVDELLRWVTIVTGRLPPEPGGDSGPVYLAPPDALIWPQTLEDLDEATGFSLADVSTYGVVYAAPNDFTVLGGDFDEHTLSDELVDLGDGVRSLGEGDDLHANPAARHPLDQLGRPVRLAERAGSIAYSLRLDLIVDWRAGEGARVGDDPDLAAVADALDEGGVISAFLVDPPSGFGELRPGSAEDIEAQEERWDRLTEIVIDQELAALGIGFATVDGGAAPMIVYRFGSAEAAAASVERIERLFAEGESLRSGDPLTDLLDVVDLRVDGATVVVHLRLGRHGVALQLARMLLDGDLPFLTLPNARDEGLEPSDGPSPTTL